MDKSQTLKYLLHADSRILFSCPQLRTGTCYSSVVRSHAETSTHSEVTGPS